MSQDNPPYHCLLEMIKEQNIKKSSLPLLNNLNKIPLAITSNKVEESILYCIAYNTPKGYDMISGLTFYNDQCEVIHSYRIGGIKGGDRIDIKYTVEEIHWLNKNIEIINFYDFLNISHEYIYFINPKANNPLRIERNKNLYVKFSWKDGMEFYKIKDNKKYKSFKVIPRDRILLDWSNNSIKIITDKESYYNGIICDINNVHFLITAKIPNEILFYKLNDNNILASEKPTYSLIL